MGGGMYVCAHMCARKCIQTHANTKTHTHTHTHTCSLCFSVPGLAISTTSVVGRRRCRFGFDGAGVDCHVSHTRVTCHVSHVTHLVAEEAVAALCGGLAHVLRNFVPEAAGGGGAGVDGVNQLGQVGGVPCGCVTCQTWFGHMSHNALWCVRVGDGTPCA